MLPSDGEFCRSSHSLQYYLTRQGRHVVLRGGNVTLPLLESYLNWVAGPMPPPTRRLDDLTSPASSENTPPMDRSRKLPRRLRPRLIRKKQSTSSVNENAESHVADPATLLGPSANENSASSAATRPRSTANRNSPFPESQPGTSQPPRSALKKHPQSFHPLSIHSIPGQQPMKIQNADLAWTTLKSGGYINQHSTASGKTLSPASIEDPSLDLTSPHLPYSNFIEAPSLNHPLGS